MKSILLSIRPEQVANILNGKQTIIVRKKFPKDYVGWVYIYVAKSTPELYVTDDGFVLTDFELGEHYKYKCLLNGKVVARFWCDKVEEFFALRNGHGSSLAGYYDYDTGKHINQELIENSFGNFDDFHNFCRTTNNNLFAIYISKLEVFDKPKELYEFNFYENGAHLCKDCLFVKQGNKCDTYHCNSLTKAPSNYCYIESEK